MSHPSIRLRVTVAFALAMALVLAGSGFYLYQRLGSHLDNALDNDLRLRSQDLTALMAQPGASLHAEAGARLIERGESYAQLLDARARVLDSTPLLGRTPLLTRSRLRAAGRGPIYVAEPPIPGLDEPSRLLARPVERDGRTVVLAVGATAQNRAETLARFRDELLIAGPAALLLASLTGYLLAGLSLRQVETMRRRAAAISSDTPGERLPVPPTGDELQRLGDTLNEMLGRLEAALARERDFVADAGHELRTPLALLRTELELALHQGRSRAELRDAIRRSSQEADRLSQLAEDLLLIARTDRGRLPLQLEDIAVDDLFASVRSRFDWRAQAAGTPIHTVPASGLCVRADRLRLQQGLANLVDNALRHGRGAVHLEARAANGHVELHVRDGGAGFPAEFLPRAFERFTRGHPTRASRGAGLGLAITRTIAEAHDGSAHAANTPPAGADVWIALPTRCDPATFPRS
jgi:two-component system, OmpR family, sensor kinase